MTIVYLDPAYVEYVKRIEDEIAAEESGATKPMTVEQMVAEVQTRNKKLECKIASFFYIFLHNVQCIANQAGKTMTPLIAHLKTNQTEAQRRREARYMAKQEELARKEREKQLRRDARRKRRVC